MINFMSLTSLTD
jgi:hypothetical protein